LKFLIIWFKYFEFILNFKFQISNFKFSFYPCACLCFGFEQITYTRPRRLTILHLLQIFFIADRTFIIDNSWLFVSL